MDTHDEPNFLQRRTRLGLILAVWTFVALVDASQYFLYANHFQGRPVSWTTALLSAAGDWYVWALLTPFLYSLAVSFPLEGRKWPLTLFIHLLAGTLVVFFKVVVDLPLSWLIHGRLPMRGSTREVYEAALTVKFLTYCLIYWGVLGVCYALEYYRKFRERGLRASQLEARLAQAQLQMLKMQLHPHFLFNTLNTVAALMHRDLALADRVLARLGEMLRTTLESGAAQEVSLFRELEFIQPYLEIEQARLGPRLHVALEVEPDALDALVPYLVLLPLVENAVRYGVAPRPEGGRVEVRAWREEGNLHLEVRDDGPGVPEDKPPTEGIGLANTRARLRQLYGEGHHFASGNRAKGGFAVALTIPFHQGHEEAATLIHEELPLAGIPFPAGGQP